MKKLLLSCFLAASVVFVSKAQTTIVTVEAESGKLGSDWNSLTDLGLEYITPKTDVIEPSFPSSEIKVASYSIKFPKAGEYELYMKAKVGSGGADDDSFFFGKAFGKKDVSNSNDWGMINNFFNKGYASDKSPLVVEEAGEEGTGTWKWINVSKFGKLRLARYKVEDGQLTQIFQIAGREDGLAIEKFAFVSKGASVTVEQLNNGK